MELIFALLFLAAGVFFIILGFYQEYEEKVSDEQEEKSDVLVMVFWGFSSLCFFLGGVCMMWITQWYYDLTALTFVESPPMSIYQSFMWVGIGAGIFVLLFLIPKILSVATEEALEHPE